LGGGRATPPGLTEVDAEEQPLAFQHPLALPSRQSSCEVPEAEEEEDAGSRGVPV
jgi:hypothetical protein